MPRSARASSSASALWIRRWCSSATASTTRGWASPIIAGSTFAARPWWRCRGRPRRPADRDRRPSRVAKGGDGGPPGRSRLHRGFARFRRPRAVRRTGAFARRPTTDWVDAAGKAGSTPPGLAFNLRLSRRPCRAPVQGLAAKPRRDPPSRAKKNARPAGFATGQPDRDQCDQQVAGLHQPRSDRHPARKRSRACATNMSC